MSLSAADIAVVPKDGRTGITLLAKEIVISGNRANLAAHLDGILMYSNTTEEGKGVDYAANEGRFEGLIYSPRAQSKIKWAGSQNILTGALIGYRVEYSGERNQLIGTFNPHPAGAPVLALIE